MSLAFVRGIHRRSVNSPHKRPVTRKMFPFDDVIMLRRLYRQQTRVCVDFKADLTHLPMDKMAAILADDIFKRIFLNDNVRISIQISLKFVPRGSINNKPALIQVMAWRRTGDKPLPEEMLTQWRIYAAIAWGDDLTFEVLSDSMSSRQSCWMISYDQKVSSKILKKNWSDVTGDSTVCLS